MPSLTEREFAVLRTLRQVRLMTSRQLERMHFSDVTDRDRRWVLARLSQRRYIRRLPRPIGGTSRGGSAQALWALDVAGQRVTNGAGPAGGYRIRRPWIPGDAFIAHTLAISELLVRLTEAARRGDLELLAFEGEPWCWRRFYGPSGTTTVKPDAAIRIGGPGYIDTWFIEVDRATQAPAVLQRKCAVYRAFWGSGQEQTLHGAFPKVLFAVPTVARHEVVTTILSRQPAESWPIFGVSLFDDVVERLKQGAQS